MKTQKILFLMTTISCLLFSCSTSEGGSSQAGDTSKQEASSSQAQSSEKSSLPTFGDLDHVKVFVSKDTNAYAYNNIYAYQNNTSIVGNWPGVLLTSYDNEWLTYDFDKKYTQFSIILYDSTNNEQTDKAGMPISGKGAYWYYNDTLEKNDTMPDLHPQSDTSNPDQGGGGGGSTTNAENGNIFHAFDWSLKTIKDNLLEIKKAGYTAIQTSPLQRPKDYSSQYKSNNDWWKLYQPLSFDVPTSGTWIGTPTDLKALTDAAHKQGITIIVDIVANHMGGNGDTPDSAIGSYEPEIYNNRGQTFRSNGYCGNWYDRYEVTHKRMANDPGYPDLVTENKTVQNAIYDYLKQLIDNGVDGFRFDAAKHIETPFDDNKVKSDFWTNTAVRAEKYAATSKNKDIFMYGEILNETPNIPYNYYTKHNNEKLLDAVTDNTTGNNILSAVESKNSNNAARDGYNSGLPAEETVLWGESHDTYLNGDGSSKNSSQENVDKAYALVGSRKGTRALYFARPDNGADIGSGKTQNNNYKNALIASVNKLKNDMGNNNETIRADGDNTYVARHGNNGYGATIVNLKNASSATLTIEGLPDGTYKDLVGGKTYTMTNKKITINFNTTYGATVIEKVS